MGCILPRSLRRLGRGTWYLVPGKPSQTDLRGEGSKLGRGSSVNFGSHWRKLSPEFEARRLELLPRAPGVLKFLKSSRGGARSKGCNRAFERPRSQISPEAFRGVSLPERNQIATLYSASKSPSSQNGDAR